MPMGSIHVGALVLWRCVLCACVGLRLRPLGVVEVLDFVMALVIEDAGCALRKNTAEDACAELVLR